MSSIVSALRQVFGERIPPHKEHLLRRSQSLEFADSPSSPYPSFSSPSSPAKKSSKSHRRSATSSLLPLSSISIDVLSDCEDEPDATANISQDNSPFILTTNEYPSNNNFHYTEENNNNNTEQNYISKQNQNSYYMDIENMERDDRTLVRLPSIPEEEEDEDEDENAQEDIENEEEEGSEEEIGEVVSEDEGVMHENTDSQKDEDHMAESEGDESCESNIKESYRCKGQGEPEGEEEEEREAEEEVEEAILIGEPRQHENENNVDETNDIRSNVTQQKRSRVIDETDGEDEEERGRQLDMEEDEDERKIWEKESTANSNGITEIEMEEIRPKTEERPKKLGKNKISVLQLSTQGDNAFGTRRGAHDNFYVKLNKGMGVEGGEPHETKGVVVDCADYQVTVLPFIMALARALHTCGVPAHSTERMLTLLSNCFGIDAHFFYTPTGIFCSFNHPKPVFALDKHTYMQLVRLPMVDWDMERLTFLEELCDDVIASRVHVSQGVAAINDIMNLPLRYTPIFEVAAVVVLSLGYAVLFGFSWSEARASGLAGVWTGLMLSVARKYPSFSDINPVVSRFGAGVIVSIFGIFVTPVHALLSAISALMYHLPSLSITIAITELTTGNLVAGTSRFVGAFSAIFQVGFGSWTGITVVGLYSKNESEPPPHPEEWYWLIFATLIASIGNSILSRVPPKLYWVTFISCTLGTLGYQAGIYLFHPTFGAFMGAFFICIFANIYARKVKRGLALVPMWSGMLLLVPGSIGVRTLLYLGGSDLEEGTARIVILLQNATALALGLFTANTLANPYKTL